MQKLMRDTVDDNWQRLKHRIKEFWHKLIGEKGREGLVARG
jgi:hypothetical protein